ncbi:MAG TPA: hypothetical protein VLE51_00795 [Candidatus Saccharimonadales bacterium]|nr:hypothetical protein [Candidatus Saccharimonadales bacterium]
MAVYKVIQDIEAEDRLLGPLTLKGFIYALTAGALGFINFKLLMSPELGAIRWLLVLLFGLPMLLFMVLASPLGREQPTEVWLLSRVRFLVKPRKKIWDQSGLSDLVTITVPPKVDRHLTKDLSQGEVQGRLESLAMAMDTGGWAVKNINVNLNTQPTYLENGAADSDRLVGASSLTQNVPVIDIHPADDIMDEQNNPTAQKFEGLMQQKDAKRKKEMAEKINNARNDSQPSQLQPKESSAQKVDSAQTVTKEPAQAARQFHFKQPQTNDTPQKSQLPPASNQSALQKSEVTVESRADKLELAQSGNDLSVASIAHLANRQPRIQQVSPNEVVISLH